MICYIYNKKAGGWLAHRVEKLRGYYAVVVVVGFVCCSLPSLDYRHKNAQNICTSFVEYNRQWVGYRTEWN